MQVVKRSPAVRVNLPWQMKCGERSHSKCGERSYSKCGERSYSRNGGAEKIARNNDIPRDKSKS